MHVRYLPQIDAQGLDEALSRWPRQRQQFGVLALLPEAERAALPLLQARCRHFGLPLLGAIFPAVIADGGFVSRGVVLSSFDAEQPWFILDQLTDDAGRSARRIGDEIERRLPPQAPGEEANLFLIYDSMVPNIGSILAKLFDHLRHCVRYSGVNAGSESFQPMPCLFDGHRCLGNGVLGLLLPAQRTIGLQHRYPVARTLFRATSTTHNCIDQIDGQAAMQVYQRLIQEEFGVTLTPENFYDYAVHYPFGLIGSLEVLVRIPVAFTETGSIVCVGEIPPNSMLRLLQAPSLEASACVTALAEQMGHQEEPLLAFYCAGRRLHFGADAEKEIIRLQKACQATPLVGALSLGEIGCDAELGIPEFHNAAIVCLR